MNNTELRNLKISIIADIQSQVDKEIKKWCAVDSKFIEKRSIPHGDSKVFKDKRGKSFTINKKVIELNRLFKGYYPDETQLKKPLIIKTIADDLVKHMQDDYSLHAKCIQNREELSSYHQGVKFIFHGLIYINEDTVQLEYGLTNIVDDVDNTQYV